MKPLVSVIVPVYNTEEYLPQCLNSLLGQTLEQIEILLIDDGSTDGSPGVCAAYVKRDARIRIITHRENLGLSAARNTGIAAARADYLMFVDSDDWVAPDFCRLPYEAAVEHCADLVMFSYYRVEKGKLKRPSGKVPSGLFTREEAIQLIDTSNISIGPMAWNKLYARSIFNSVAYPVGHLCEDIGTTHKLCHAANTIICLAEFLYYYRAGRNGSITSMMSSQFLQDRSDFYFQKNLDLAAWGYDVETPWRIFALRYMVWNGSNQPHSIVCDEVIKSISGYPSYFKPRYNVMLFLYRHSPPLFDFVCRITGKRIVK